MQFFFCYCPHRIEYAFCITDAEVQSYERNHSKLADWRIHLHRHLCPAPYSFISRSNYRNIWVLTAKATHWVAFKICDAHYWISVPPHSTTVNPLRSGADSSCSGISAKESVLCHAINTRIKVSGAGSTLSCAASV